MNRIFLFISISIIIVSCKKDDNQEEFDRGAMLSNMASAVIKPGLANLAADLEQLDISANAFSTSADNASLTQLRTDFVTAYKSFQQVKMFNFGPMMTYGVKASMNTFPCDTAQIQSNISSGSYTLTALDNVDAIGFPAIDFLLYYQGDAAVLNSFNTASDAANRKTYLTDITEKMKTEFDLVKNEWDTYEADFVASDGNDVGSSTSALFNEWIYDIELLKNAKIGIPAGQQTGGMTLPDYVEGRYGELSITLAKESATALKNVFLGATGIGFDDYIIDVEGEDVNPSLATNIINQFDVVNDKLDAIGSPLSEKVDTNPTAVNDCWLEIKKLVTYIKTDMSSTLGLLITFQDNDGD